MKKILFLLISIIGIVNAATSQITVSILPQKYFVEKITKDKFEINVMVQPGSSPHTYEPKTSQMKALAASKVYFSTGVSFEHVWLDKFKKNAKKTLFVDLSNGIEKLAMAEHEHHDEEEHEEHKDEHKAHDHDEHKHEAKDNHDGEDGLDPHIWLDPILVKIQAKNIYDTMLKVDTQNADFYKENYESFLNEIDNTFLKIKQKINGSEITTVYAFDDYWDYFANRFRLNIIKKEKKHLDIAKISSSINFTKDKNIQKILFFKGMDYNVLLSYTNNLNLQVIENDIFDDIWQTNLLEFSQKLFKTNNQHEN